MKYLLFTLVILLSLTIASARLATAQIPAGEAVEHLDLPTAFSPDRSNRIVYSSDGKAAFAASFETDTLFIFDPDNGALLSTIPTGDGPSRLAISESGARRVIAVANTAFIGSPVPSVTFIDATELSRPALISTAELGKKFFLNGDTTILALNSNGTVGFVTATASKGSVSLFSIDVNTGNILDQLRLDSIPINGVLTRVSGKERLIINSNGANGSSSKLLIVDTENARSLGATSIVLPAGFSKENNIVASGDGSLAYLASADSGGVYAIDLKAGRITAQANAGRFPGRVDLLDDGQKRLLSVVAIGDGSVNTFDASGQKGLDLISTFRSQSSNLTTAPALSRDGLRGYVATEIGGNRLYTFDTATGRQVNVETLDGPPVDLQIFRGATERLGILDTVNHRVRLFEPDSDTLRVAGTFATPDGVGFSLTQNILLSRDGRRAFVASPTNNELLVIDTEKRAVEQRIAVGRQPEMIALVEADGTTRLAVINVNSKSVSLVEVVETSSRVTGTVELPNANAGVLGLTDVAFTRDGHTGFICDGATKVIKFDAVSGETLDQLDLGPQPTGLALFEQNGERRLAVISNPTDRPAAVILIDATDRLRERARYSAAVGQRFALNNLPLFSSDGQFVFITASLSLELLSIDASTGRLVSRQKGINAPVPTLFSRQGRDWLIAVNAGDIRFPILEVDATGRLQQRARLKAPKGNFFIVGNNAAVAQGATRAYVANYVGGQFFLFDPATGNILQTVALGKGPGNLALSSDNSLLLVIETNGTANRISFIGL